MCLMILENMSEFNFKSSVCTSIEQSERLLALGLKKETADMFYAALHKGTKVVGYRISPVYNDEQFEIFTDDIPVWSLHRLIEMALRHVLIYAISFNFNEDAYEKVIRVIECQIKSGHFNKEYLEE